MVAAQDEIVVILQIAILRVSLDGESRGQRRRIAASGAMVPENAFGLEPDFCQAIAKRFVVIAAGIVVDVAALGRGGEGFVGGKVGVRLVVIVVVEFEDPRR